MAVRQYIGARYVPKFFEGEGGSSDWVSGIPYEPLTIVTYLGTSFTSKKAVPVTAGAPNENPDYWVVTGNYNAQVEEYRQMVEEYHQEVEGFDGRITAVEGEVTGLEAAVAAVAGDVTTLGERVTTLEGDMGVLSEKVDNIEDVIEGEVEGITTGITQYDNGTEPTAVAAYTEGTLFWKDGSLYVATVDIAQGETITPGVNCETFSLSDKLGGVDEEIEKLKYKDFGVRMAYYVDAVNGSDDNDGLSATSAMKTLQYAYETAYRNGYTDLTFLLLTGGEYVIDDRRFTNTSLHFTTNFSGGGASGVKVKLGDGTYAPYFYNCYVHFSGVAENKMEVNAPLGIHCDGADVYCGNAHLTATGTSTTANWDCANANLNIVGCEVDEEVSLYVRGGFFRIEGTNKFNWTPNAEQSAIRGQNVFMAIFAPSGVTNSLGLKALTQDAPADKWLCQIQVGVLRFEPRFNAFSENGFKFTGHAIRLRTAFASFSSGAKTDLAGTSLTGSNIPDGGTSIMAPNGNVWIPESF